MNPSFCSLYGLGPGEPIVGLNLDYQIISFNEVEVKSAMVGLKP